MIHSITTNQVDTKENPMSIIVVAYIIIGYVLMALMSFKMAKYNERNPWLWAVLTVLFGAIPMAYVFFVKSRKYSQVENS